MINYTERISLLVRDIVSRVPRLSHVDPDDLLVFARYGRRGASGAVATCHCLSLPPSEPGYYYWRDSESGRMTRCSPWFVTMSPHVSVRGRCLSYLISFALPRFCDQSLAGSKKQRYYEGVPAWVAKLDTIVHELYHIDPALTGIRRVERRNGCAAAGSHGHAFLGQVAELVREYLASEPDPARYDFLHYRFSELEARYGGVVGTTFRTFPSFPQRYNQVLPAAAAPALPAAVPIQPLPATTIPTEYSERDLRVRRFRSRAGKAHFDRADTGAASPSLSQEASCLGESLVPVSDAQRFFPHAAVRAGRVHERIGADGDADVRDRAAVDGEEDQVPRPEMIPVDALAD